MYDPIFRKSFSRFERKRIGFCALFLCFIVVLAISSTFKPHLHPFSPIDDALKLQLSINAAKNLLTVDDTTITNSIPTGGGFTIAIDNAAEDFKFTSENKLVVNDTSTTFQPKAIENHNNNKKAELEICRNSNYCEIEAGDVRIEAKTSTIFVISSFGRISNPPSSSNIEPYPRKGTSKVKNWTLTYKNNDENIPICTQNHTHPSILFSLGGFSGNFFHDFADILFPLYSTSFLFQKQVHFLASDYKSWWINKFRQILNNLTKHNILDIQGETSQIHCYKKIIIGLKFYKELIIHPLHSVSPSAPSMQNFRLLLRRSYALETETSTRSREGHRTRPRLMIISRKRTRVITNEGQVSRLARKLGFEVVLAEAGVSSNLSRFAETVNSCHVLMGVHGAGLTNMVFLPENAVLIQVVPFGGVDEFARLDFGNPADGMNIKYLEYKINVNESSLSKKYPMDHPILKEHKMGWNEIWSIYLNQQNVTIDLHRFKGTLAKALKILRH